MRGFDEKFIDELKSKSDLTEIVGKYVHLEQKGQNFWGRCPFHHEKTASFCVNSVKQFYYCFGCHKSGDVISFVMETESLDFGDAVKFLADRAKMPLPETSYDDEKLKEQKKRKERALSLMRDTALFYVANLRKEGASKHAGYILKRKFNSTTIVRFGLGASLDFGGLPRFLKEKGYTYEEMVSAGAVGEKNGRYYDWLGGRLIIPVIDQFGNVVAFDGRRIDDGKEQKYVNTRETFIFSKGKTFFNINNLKKLKNEVGLDGVILVEGHLDVISLSQAGFENVVASMGTALTKDQARILKRYSDKVYISYDGDSAGRKATMRGLDILAEEGLEVKVLTLPDGKDPDDVIKESGKEGYARLLLEAKPLIDFKLDVLKEEFDVGTVDGRRKYVTNALKVIKESSSSAEQEDLIKEVYNQTGVPVEALRRELFGIESAKTEIVVPSSVASTDFNKDKVEEASRFVLFSYLFGKPYALETDLQTLSFPSPVYRQIQQFVVSRMKEGKEPRFNDLYEYLGKEDEAVLSDFASLETDDGKIMNRVQYFSDCVRTLKTENINAEIKRLNSLLKVETDEAKKNSIKKEINALFFKRTALKNNGL